MESLLASSVHSIPPIGEISFEFIFFGGLAQGMLVVPLFLLWDLLRNKRRPLDLEQGFPLFFRQLPWPLFYATLLILLCVTIPDGFWMALELKLTSLNQGYSVGIAPDQALTPYILNPVAILFASTRFVLRSEPASPRLLWTAWKNSWALFPSASEKVN